MDARITPLAAFGLQNGDAHVIRNAGGRVTQHTVRSLLVSTHLMGVRSIAVVHHTECGMARYTDRQLREITGVDMDFAAITDSGEDLRADVERARAAPLPVNTEVRGFLYDVATGRLRQII
jgi:carbonic anhydrase